jgi:UDP-hydrolysing UDP-N-acetyl-D-glucosamine 2-epimerase
MSRRKRKICFVITSEIHYGRNKLILQALKRKQNIELQIVVGASALLPAHGNVLELLKRDRFTCNARITMTLAGGDPVAMAKTAGVGITEFATAFDNLRPDIVMIRGDRYEVLSAAVAAAYLNIPIAHIEGGDVTGTIDESVRHAITKLSHIHFATTEHAHKRIIRMGENPKYVFVVGSPEMEFVSKNNYSVSNELINRLGVGDVVDITKPYLIAIQHPVTSEIGKNRKHVEETLHAVYELKVPTIWFWPNVDAGTDETSKGIRAFRENYNPKHVRFLKYLPPEEFIGLLRNSSALVGNSSTGIKECSLLGVPAVNIGTRQDGRMRAHNIIDVPYDREHIKKALHKQIKRGRYEPSHLYYRPGTSKKIADILATIKTYTQKRFYD